MKYYSDVLNRMFETEKDLIQAENEHKESIKFTQAKLDSENKLKEKRKEEINDAIKELDKAIEHVDELTHKLNKLVVAYEKEYGTHTTLLDKGALEFLLRCLL